MPSTRSLLLLPLIAGAAGRYAFADWLIRGRREFPGVGTVLHEFAERGGARGNYSLLSDVLADCCPEPPALRGAVLIHLRLGDVVCRRGGRRDREPPSVELLAALLRARLPPELPKFLLWGMHLVHGACERESVAYVASARAALNASEAPTALRHLLGYRARPECASVFSTHVRPPRPSVALNLARRADADLCSLVGAGIFVPGKSGFSEVAARVRAVRQRRTLYLREIAFQVGT